MPRFMAFLLLISLLISFHHHSSLGEAADAEHAAFLANPSQQMTKNVEATTESVQLHDYSPSKPNPIHSPPNGPNHA